MRVRSHLTNWKNWVQKIHDHARLKPVFGFGPNRFRIELEIDDRTYGVIFTEEEAKQLKTKLDVFFKEYVKGSEA